MRKSINYFFLMVVLALGVTVVSSCQQQAKKSDAPKVAQIRQVSVDEFEKCIADRDNVILVDVRTQAEYDEGHIEGAILIDVNTGDFRKEASHNLSSAKTIAVYCRKGKRSDAAGNILVEEGYDVVNLLEGFDAWQAAGKKVVR